MGLDPATVVAIITALAGLVVAYSSRRKTDAEVAKSDAEVRRAATEATLSLIGPLREQVAELRGEVATLRKRVAEFRRGIRILCGQVRQLGAEPLWEPSSDDADWDQGGG